MKTLKVPALPHIPGRPPKEFIFLLLSFLATMALALGAFFYDNYANRYKREAKFVAGKWVKCSYAGQGLYHARVYDKESGFLKEQTFMVPYKKWFRSRADLTARITKYADDAIHIDNGVKLLPCGVPESAKAVRSVEGVLWVDCRAVNLKESIFICEFYSTKDGRLVSSGAYSPRKFRWNKERTAMVFSPVKHTALPAGFLYYDGTSVALGNGTVLMPVDSVDFPAGPDNGLRVKFDSQGREIERVEYQNS